MTLQAGNRCLWELGKRLGLAAWVAAFAVQCTPAFEGEYADPGKEEIVDDRWNETDAQKTAKSMVDAALGGSAGSARWLSSYKGSHSGNRPVVFVDEVENRTDEHIDTQMLTEYIRDELINSGRVRFINVKRRQKIMSELKYQHGGAVDPSTAKKIGKQLGADFMLGGAVSSSVHTQGGLKTVTYQVALNLTNLESAELEWSKKHLIKKRFKRSSSSW